MHLIWIALLLSVFSSVLPAAPAISPGGIVNASGYQTVLAPNAVFVVFGMQLGPAALVSADAPSYPANLGGTSIAFTPQGGGPGVTTRLVYSSAGQVAGLLPSSITPGAYNVTVTFNGETSPAQPVTVVSRSFGIATANSAGSGAAQATIGNVNGGISLVRLTSGSTSFSGLTWTLAPARPGDTIVLWGTGGGADPANDTGGSSGDQTAAGNFRVLVGERALTPLYAGTSTGFPGLWQINVQLPADVERGCFVPLQVSAGGELSNIGTIAIAAPGRSSCESEFLSSEALTRLDRGDTLTGGGFTFNRMTATNSFLLPDGTRTPVVTATAETGSGGIARYSAAAVAELNSGIRVGECLVFPKTDFQTRIGIGLPSGYLDAGAALAVSGPGLAPDASLARLPEQNYSSQFPPSSILGGAYTLSAPGGADVAAFQHSLDVPGDFTPTNFGAISRIDRGQPLTFNWTGAASANVQVNGTFWATLSGDSSNPASWRLRSMTFTCEVPGSRGALTVPAAVFNYLPPSHPDLTSGNYAYLSITAVLSTRQSLFRFPLTGGGRTDWGTINFSIGATKNLPVVP